MRPRNLVLASMLGLQLICSGSTFGQCIHGVEIKPDSGYSYMREEIKALESIRKALDESDRLSDPPIIKDDPQIVHKEVEFYSALNDVKDFYSCAESLLRPFSESKNSSIRDSVSALLLGIQTFEETNSDMTKLVEAIKKTSNLEELNGLEIGKRLADIKSIQKDARTLVILGVRMSTFSIIKYEGEGEAAKPVAFLIDASQHQKILVDLRQLKAAKRKSETYIDVCVDGVGHPANLDVQDL